MNNNIDNLLSEIGSDVPKVNPYLQNKIYNNAINRKSKKSFSFFKNPLVVTFSSILVFLVLLVGALNLRNIPFNDSKYPDSGASSIYVPTLSPNNQNTVFIDFHYAVYTEQYACVTLVINNKIDYQTIYIKNYGKKIENVQLNNGDVAQNATTTSAADELKKFKELLDIGAITQEEFDAKKKELLGL
jgi:hypothetical protein